jgi:hypothetical protein
VHGLFHAGKGIDQFLIQLAFVTDGADDGTFSAARDIDFEAEFTDFFDYAIDLFFVGAIIHNDNH